MLRRPRLLFYAVNGLGLGHVTRLIAIARQVRRRVPDAEILFLTSSEAESVIYREGFAAFKVPSKTLRAQVNIRSATYARLLQTVTINIMAAFNPHVLVVDTFPAGVIQELLPVLRWDARKVFVYRVQRAEAATSALMQNTLQLYDLAIIPHYADEEDTPLPPGLQSVWTGPILIRDRSETLSREEARQQLNLPSEAKEEKSEAKVVYVTFGGGGDAEMNRALHLTVEALTALSDLHLAVACAPLYRGRLPRHDRVTPVDYYPMAEMAAAFDAAVSAVGYNTTMELLHHGVPTVFVPFARQVDDQEARAQRIASAGAGLYLPILEPAPLQTAVLRLLDPHQATALREAAREMVPGSGADHAAQAILSLLPQ
jgi:UDP-N-acetylglucosamine--N-acetylmuramyl-(pentapeptide) pyrophosphoryl-undecaprenol N-acetylglucosamine transferase